MRTTILKSTAGLLLGLLCLSASAQQFCNEAIRPSAPAARFIDNGDGTVTDVSTGLMWTVCALGQEWQHMGCNGEPVESGWHDALYQVQAINAAGLGTAGWDDWRIPNIKELISIVEWACLGPAIDTSVFAHDSANLYAARYWSSSPAYDSGRPLVWSFNFMGANLLVIHADSPSVVRLVRDPD